MVKSAILLIYTGGTIGMKKDPVTQTLRPFDFSGILDEVPELQKFALKVDAYNFDPPIDSSDVEPPRWVELARLIKSRYDQYDGFVVLHGTDTMAYSASALSYILDGLSKPVVFTGSQLPIGVARTDGKENLISSVEIAAAKDSDGRAIVPEVSIYFGSKLMRGNRTTKYDSECFEAFASPNCPPLADAGINIRYASKEILQPSGHPFSVHPSLDTRVSILKIHPGITPGIVRNILLGDETRAVILETFGAGNAPSRGWFIDCVRQAVASGKILVNVTQCPAGRVDMDIYETGKQLKEAGVFCGYDSTTENMLAKLFHLLGESDDREWIGRMIQTPLRGDITV